MIIELHNKFKEIAETHKMISSFEYDGQYEIETTGETSYPALILEDEYTVDGSDNVNIYSLTYYLIELPKQDYSDKLYLQNKLEEINNDILVHFQLNPDGFYKLAGYNYVMLKEWNSDNTICLRCEIQLEVLKVTNNCESPLY